MTQIEAKEGLPLAAPSCEKMPEIEGGEVLSGASASCHEMTEIIREKEMFKRPKMAKKEIH